MKTSEVVMICQACGSERLSRTEEFRENGVVVDVYQCQNTECARKVVLIFEPAGGYSDEQQTFIQREIARKGAFFPADYFGGGRGLRR